MGVPKSSKLDNSSRRRSSCTTPMMDGSSRRHSSCSSQDDAKRVLRKNNDRLQSKLDAVLGEGPLRFGPPCYQPDFMTQFRSLCQKNPHLVTAYAATKVEYDDWTSSRQGHKANKDFTDAEILRVVQYCKYNESKAAQMLKKTDPRYLRVSSQDLEEQLMTKTLFPLDPSLTTKDGQSVFYMRPSRYFPKQHPTRAVISNLMYVMNSVYQRTGTYDDENHGMAFVANTNDWTWENFSTDYCLKFMQGLQGMLGPLNVDLFLIVNPPSWFNKVWKLMKPMLSSSFRRKVHMIPETKLHKYLAPGYEKYLPDEFATGKCRTDQLVLDFVEYRMALESVTSSATNNQRLASFGSLNVQNNTESTNNKDDVQDDHSISEDDLCKPGKSFGGGSHGSTAELTEHMSFSDLNASMVAWKRR